MREPIGAAFITLDGVIQAPGSAADRFRAICAHPSRCRLGANPFSFKHVVNSRTHLRLIGCDGSRVQLRQTNSENPSHRRTRGP